MNTFIHRSVFHENQELIVALKLGFSGATLHVFLRQNHGDMAPEDTVECGPSTSNRFERWWPELHERFGIFFTFQLQQLLEQGFYDRKDESYRKILAYVFILFCKEKLIYLLSYGIIHEADFEEITVNSRWILQCYL